MVLRSMLPRQQEGGVLWTGISGAVSALTVPFHPNLTQQPTVTLFAFLLEPGRPCPWVCEGGGVHADPYQTWATGWRVFSAV